MWAQGKFQVLYMNLYFQFFKGSSRNKFSQTPTNQGSLVARYSQPKQADEDALVAVLVELDQEAVLCEDALVTASETVTSLARMDEIAALLAEKREHRRTIFPKKTTAGGGFPPPAWLLWSVLPQSDRRS